MTNGLKKSDSGVVARKPANKGPSGPAEPVERRPGPKGNPQGRHTRRAQDRGSVSQAAERIRQAAWPAQRLPVTTQGRSPVR